ncbi:MAG: S9 family peptidase, partial [Bacteroidota bacterium]
MKKLLTIALLALISVPTILIAQDGETLSLQRIFSSSEFRPDWVGQLRWFDGGEAYTTLEPAEDYRNAYNIVRNSSKTGEKTTLVTAKQLIPPRALRPLKIDNYYWSDDVSKLLIYTKSKRVWRLNTKGEYWVYNRKSGKLQQLGKDNFKPSEMMFAKFSPDGTRVAYVYQHNIYVETLVDQKITQLTFDGTDKIINGTFDWAYEEEFSCRDGFSWSPDGKNIAYWQIDASGIRDFLMINNTDSIYSYTIPVQYPKAGEKPSAAKVGVVSATGGATTWMKVPGDPQNNYIPRMIWHSDGDRLLIQHLNRAQNHNKLRFLDIKTGNETLTYEDKETAWLEVVSDFQFLNNGKSFTWVSEKSGWKAAYTITGGTEKQITPAGQDMLSISLIDEANGWLYFIASPDNATQRYLYRTKLNGKGKTTRITPAEQSGTHRYQISPNGQYAQHTYSSAGSPPVIELVSLPDHKVIRTFANNERLRNKIAGIARNPMEFFEITTDEGLKLDAYMIKPTNFDPQKKYPVLFHVYGEPWSQTVVDSWGGSNYLWHLMLAQKGYIIMSVDNRGTPGPKGREWRKSVYGQIGLLSSKDQADALKWIIKTYDFVDDDRIGIWGWSGGGSMTLNMLFRYPDLYHTGMSVAPVANQLLYDNIYQERYSGVPQDMPESYQKGSPIHYAKNLKGNLLLVHGTG